jgi:dihydroorotate dehydrogenase (fumarate)
MNLETNYLGIDLKSPIVASSSPLTRRLDTLQRLEDAGVGAVVLPSLFEEQIEHEELEIQRILDYGAENSPEADGYFPDLQDYNTGPISYLNLIRDAKKSLDIPVIASLNGATPGGWVGHAKRMEEAGADAVELNIYIMPTDPDVSGAEVEQRYIDLVVDVRDELKVPLAVKIGPYFSSMPNMARQLESAGADGLVLFNRFLHPDIALEELRVTPRLDLSTSSEMRLPLRWIAILREHMEASLAATSGAHVPSDAIKLILAGADVVMVASSLLQRGPEHAQELIRGMRAWMLEHDYESVEQMRGAMCQENSPDPEAFERANYMEALTSYTMELP